jgi:hypothetical protein
MNLVLKLPCKNQLNNCLTYWVMWKIWKINARKHCSLKLSGRCFILDWRMPEIKLKWKKSGSNKIVLGAASDKLPFTLIANIDSVSDSSSEVKLDFGEILTQWWQWWSKDLSVNLLRHLLQIWWTYKPLPKYKKAKRIYNSIIFRFFIQFWATTVSFINTTSGSLWYQTL